MKDLIEVLKRYILTLLIFTSTGCADDFGPSPSAAALRAIELRNSCTETLDEALNALQTCEDKRTHRELNYFDDDACQEFRGFIYNQLKENSKEILDSNLFRFEAHGFMGICLVRDNKHDKVYEVTTKNVKHAMYLNKDKNLRIPSVEFPDH